MCGPDTPPPLRLCCPGRMDPRTLGHHRQACCRRHTLGYFPLVLLAPIVRPVAQAKGRPSLSPLHEAISHLRSSSTHSYPPISDAHDARRKSRPPTTLCCAAPPVDLPGGPFPRPRTSGLPVVERFLGAITAGCMRPFVPTTCCIILSRCPSPSDREAAVVREPRQLRGSLPAPACMHTYSSRMAS